MIDRFELELLLVEQICDRGAEELVALFQQLTGKELNIIFDDDWEEISGSPEALTIANPVELKKALEFLLDVLAEVEIPVED